MKKIKILKKINGDQIKRFLLSSDRKYESIELKGNYFGGFCCLFSAKGRRWIDISIEKVEFENAEEFLRFLMIFQASIQKLVIPDGKIKDNVEANWFKNSDLQFP